MSTEEAVLRILHQTFKGDGCHEIMDDDDHMVAGEIEILNAEIVDGELLFQDAAGESFSIVIQAL